MESSTRELSILTTEVRLEQDVVASRRRARQIAVLLGFPTLDQTRIATAVSEIARNAYRYAGGGRIRFGLRGTHPQYLVIQVTDGGPGIRGLDDILEGRYRSRTGMGQGLIGVKRLMDLFEVETAPGKGTHVLLGRLVPGQEPISPARVLTICQELGRLVADDPLAEMQAQNRELLEALTLVQRQKAELVDTNRGIVALLAELEDKAEFLRRADELKSRFLANISHEFRTPLSSVLSLTHMLLEEEDGALGTEQTTQVTLIRNSVLELTEMVNDLLDLAKVQAGKVSVHPGELALADLFSGLRGMMRPLRVNESVALVFEEPPVTPIYTDAGKVSQILRNLLSNALKFTEHGEIRVSAHIGPGAQVTMSVTDTGLGIAPEDLKRIFEEFGQLDSPIQRRVKGTGLGLSLSRQFAEMLGGTLSVSSVPGGGSVFSLVLPTHYTGFAAQIESTPDVVLPPAVHLSGPARIIGPVGALVHGASREKLLIIDDDETARYLFRRLMADAPYYVVEARGGPEGLKLAAEQGPLVIFLDLEMPDMTGFEVLEALKSSPLTRQIPVIINTSRPLELDERERLSALTTGILTRKLSSEASAVAQVNEFLEKARAVREAFARKETFDG